MKEHVIRLEKNDDLVKSIEIYCRKEEIKAAYVATCVGSLVRACMRKGVNHALAVFQGPYEIISLNGTISRGGMHLHIGLSDEDFRMIGGHVIEGCIVLNTAEIVIIEIDQYELARDRSDISTYKELLIKRTGDN